jgi:hypothetical protein
MSTSSDKDDGIHFQGDRTVYTAGRPPWYNTNGQIKEPLVIGLFLKIFQF